MSKDRLLSDKELIEELVKNVVTNDSGPTITAIVDVSKLLHLINTQKRLYAESELSKLKHKASYDPSGSSPVINPREIDAAIAEQRRSIK